jgi:hypothetical protein
MVACVAREVKLRQAVYPGQIQRGKMSAQEADREIRRMEAVLEYLKAAREARFETEDEDLDKVPEEPRQFIRKERNR